MLKKSGILRDFVGVFLEHSLNILRTQVVLTILPEYPENLSKTSPRFWLGKAIFARNYRLIDKEIHVCTRVGREK